MLFIRIYYYGLTYMIKYFEKFSQFFFPTEKKYLEFPCLNVYAYITIL